MAVCRPLFTDEEHAALQATVSTTEIFGCDAKPGFFDDRQNCEISSAHRSTALSALDWNSITILCTVLLFYV